ncbi:hypothetical protein [Kitasatospora sp. MAP5-34]|uniref:hypothetical protein n=1 Tax=Kitasatospora sp. MAP5-34 TaxID=3035102 RepID=UPI0024738733|nr:hypothetical protein [Kitasatospora sp. MAP5-34]MDH6578011.1 hypothetical protein [Kitasatospora sp. MAP5-34]
MSYAPPTGGLPVPPARDRARALPGLAVLLIIGLILELAVLGFDLNQDGPAYLPTALGFTFGGAQNAPVGFFGGDAATCMAFLVMIIAAFSGRGWIRAAGTVLLLVGAYNSFQMLSIQLTGSDESRSGFAQPLNHLLLNLDEIAQIGLAVIFTVVVTATVRRNGPAAPAGPAVGFPGTPPGFAPYQQQPGYAPAPAAYAYPPAPTEGPTPS